MEFLVRCNQSWVYGVEVSDGFACCELWVKCEKFVLGICLGIVVGFGVCIEDWMGIVMFSGLLQGRFVFVV